MSGIIAPSIVNYRWWVKSGDISFLNVSFPFRVKIESIWFTTNVDYSAYGLWSDGEGSGVDLETTERLLRLAAFKTKNSKTQHNATDDPTDVMEVFENEEGKPTMWLGNPDDAAGRIGAFTTRGAGSGHTPSLRSTAVAPIDKAQTSNDDWAGEETPANTYLADVAIMNTDEFLQLFIYDAGGDWSGYQNEGEVTISVAYTGIHDTEAASATAKTWTAWWND